MCVSKFEIVHLRHVELVEGLLNGTMKVMPRSTD